MHLPAPFIDPTPGTAPVPTFRLGTSVTFTEEYTDNFRLTAGNRVENFRSSLGVGLSLAVSGARTRGSIGTSVSVTHDTATGETGLDLFPLSLGANFRYDISPRMSVTVSDTLARGDLIAESSELGLRGQQRELFTSNSFSIALDWLIGRVSTQTYYRNSIFFSDRDTVSHGAGVNASAPIGLRTTLRGGYEFSRSGTSGDISRDSTGHTVFGSVARQLGRFASVGVSGSYALQSFRGTSIWDASVFAAYGLPTGLSISGSLGYSVLQADGGVDSDGITTSTTVSYRFAQATASLAVFQAFRQTGLTGEDLGVTKSRGASASLSFPVTPATSASIIVSYSENEFTGVGNNPLTPTSRSVRAGVRLGTALLSGGVTASYSENLLLGTGAEQTARTARDQITFGADLSWQVYRWLSMRLAYAHLERGEQASSGGDVRENRVSLSLAAAF
jgi:hypothetical protein